MKNARRANGKNSGLSKRVADFSRREETGFASRLRIYVCIRV